MGMETTSTMKRNVFRHAEEKDEVFACATKQTEASICKSTCQSRSFFKWNGIDKKKLHPEHALMFDKANINTTEMYEREQAC